VTGFLEDDEEFWESINNFFKDRINTLFIEDAVTEA
jgi:hypothetical protein